ncbi:MAG: hypothetical protein OEZ06_32625 [Myxococcales bacterium]|nr:hypothetical protein [Myxococcales bacterium]
MIRRLVPRRCRAEVQRWGALLLGAGASALMAWGFMTSSARACEPEIPRPYSSVSDGSSGHALDVVPWVAVPRTETASPSLVTEAGDEVETELHELVSNEQVRFVEIRPVAALAPETVHALQLAGTTVATFRTSGESTGERHLAEPDYRLTLNEQPADDIGCAASVGCVADLANPDAEILLSFQSEGGTELGGTMLTGPGRVDYPVEDPPASPSGLCVSISTRLPDGRRSELRRLCEGDWEVSMLADRATADAVCEDGVLGLANAPSEASNDRRAPGSAESTATADEDDQGDVAGSAAAAATADEDDQGDEGCSVSGRSGSASSGGIVWMVLALATTRIRKLLIL